MLSDRTYNKKFVCLGKILSSYGINGLIKIKSYTDPEISIIQYSPLIDINNNIFSINSILCNHINDNILFVFINDINSKEESLKLKGVRLFIYRFILPKIFLDNVFYYSDIKGLSALNCVTGIKSGNVFHVENYGGGDILNILCKDNSYLMLPFSNDTIPYINVIDGFLLFDYSLSIKD